MRGLLRLPFSSNAFLELEAQATLARHQPGPADANGRGMNREQILKPACMLAVKEGWCSAQDLINLSYNRLKLIANPPQAINAMREGRTTFEALKDLPMDELQHAVETDEYPGHGIGLDH